MVTLITTLKSKFINFMIFLFAVCASLGLSACSNIPKAEYIFVETPEPEALPERTNYKFNKLTFDDKSFYCIDSNHINNYIIEKTSIERVLNTNYKILKDLHLKTTKNKK